MKHLNTGLLSIVTVNITLIIGLEIYKFQPVFTEIITKIFLNEFVYGINFLNKIGRINPGFFMKCI